MHFAGSIKMPFVISLIFVMLLCITKFLSYVLIKYMFCVYHYTNVKQFNSGFANTIHIFVYDTINRGNRLSIFQTNSVW